jgi:hypothetical protein
MWVKITYFKVLKIILNEWMSCTAELDSLYVQRILETRERSSTSLVYIFIVDYYNIGQDRDPGYIF